MTRIHRDIYHVEIPMRPRITVHDSAEEEGRKQEHKRMNIHTRDKNRVRRYQTQQTQFQKRAHRNNLTIARLNRE